MEFFKNERCGRVTAFYALSLPEFHMTPHSHESFEVMYVTAGSCRISCGDETYQVSSGHFIFVSSQVSHCLEILPEHPCSILNLEFYFPAEKGILPLAELLEKSRDFSSFWEKMPPCFLGGDMRNFGYALKDLISCLQKPSDGSDFLLYLLFARTMEELAFSVVHRKKNAGLSYLKKACGYIEQNLHETIRIPELAAYTGVNKSYLQSLFSKLLGCSIIEYVNRKRLEEAEFLLINSSMSITEIAFVTGYNSRQHFAYTFEKYLGTGPLSYRKLHNRRIEPDTGKEQYILRGHQAFGQKIAD